MVFLAICAIILFIYSIFLFRKSSEPRKYSSVILIGLILAITSNIALSNNYVVNLLGPAVNDGIAVTNFLARLILWDANWSLDLFKQAYDSSTALVIVLIIFYALVLLLEKKKMIK